jgi:hypothetical protein
VSFGTWIDISDGIYIYWSIYIYRVYINIGVYIIYIYIDSVKSC